MEKEEEQYEIIRERKRLEKEIKEYDAKEKRNYIASFLFGGVSVYFAVKLIDLYQKGLEAEKNPFSDFTIDKAVPYYILFGTIAAVFFVFSCWTGYVAYKAGKEKKAKKEGLNKLSILSGEGNLEDRLGNR